MISYRWLALLATVAILGSIGSQLHAQSASKIVAPSKTVTNMNAKVAPTASQGAFKLVGRGGGPTFVTFNQCHNAAKESCIHGIESLDHEETTGNCAFTCLSAASNSDD